MRIHTWAAVSASIVAMSAPGCVGGSPPRATDFPVTERMLETLANDVAYLEHHEDVEVRCPDGPVRDEMHEWPDCEVCLLSANGERRPLELGSVRSAWRLDAGRLLVLSGDGRLLDVPIARPADARELARDVGVPQLSRDRRFAVFAKARVGGGDSVTFTRLDVESGELRDYATGDHTAYTGMAIPDSDDLLFLSGRTGIASLFRITPSGTTTQITNQGVGTTRSKGFVPAPSGGVIWLPGDTPRFAFRTGLFQGSVWLGDLEQGRFEELGQGRLPGLRADGSLIWVEGLSGGPYRITGRTEGVISR